MKDQERLSAYLDGELSAGEVRDIERRLAAEPGLRDEYLRLRQVSVSVRVHCEPDPGFLVRHRERREDLSPVLRWTWRQLGSRLAAAAAVLLVAAGLSLWQVEAPAPDTVVDAAVAGDLELSGFESEVLGEIFVAPEFETLAEGDPAHEPVLVIALGGGFAPAGGR